MKIHRILPSLITGASILSFKDKRNSPGYSLVREIKYCFEFTTDARKNCLKSFLINSNLVALYTSLKLLTDINIAAANLATMT